MSSHHLRVIPADPTWVPEPERAEAARLLLARLAPRSREVTAEASEKVEFVDSGGNFDRILCPACGSELELRWWQDAMDAAYDRESGFGSLDVVTPCCGCDSSLNDLNYTWASGFSRFVIVAKDYGRYALDEGELAQLAQALGCAVRAIYARI